MKKIVILLAISLLGIAGSIHAATPLVDVAWITANAGKSGIVFVDLRGNAAYLRGHVPGAIHTNYGKDGWREKNSARRALARGCQHAFAHGRPRGADSRASQDGGAHAVRRHFAERHRGDSRHEKTRGDRHRQWPHRLVGRWPGGDG